MIDANVGVEELIHILNMSCDKRKPPGNQGGNFLTKKEMAMLPHAGDSLSGNFSSIANHLKLI